MVKVGDGGMTGMARALAGAMDSLVEVAVAERGALEEIRVYLLAGQDQADTLSDPALGDYFNDLVDSLNDLIANIDAFDLANKRYDEVQRRERRTRLGLKG